MCCIVFVTERGGAGFEPGGPAITRARGGYRGGYFAGPPGPAPVRGMGRAGPWAGDGAGKARKNAQPLAGVRAVFFGPGGPITNTKCVALNKMETTNK